MYSLQEENELIRLAQQGNTAACEKLLTAYTGLLKNMHHRYAHTPSGKLLYDDMQGILQLAFMEAIHAFEPARGINFAAFLQSRLHGAIYKAFKNTCSYSKHTAHPTLPDNDDRFAYFDSLENHHPSPERQLLAQEKLQNIVKELTAAEKELLHLIYVRELPQKAAAQLLNITPQAVSKRKRNLITKIKKLA
ncbi:sigma-70 family RNA polymerase sigma factor [Selenomonas ruminantium]|uniref:sigma-70 family RNA polymerase sigma factor n=1 Tax=Selenomonas ruminantium TaxID=971 RepID=UPI0015691F84|nr:sigma-70 family RNA polymerase sigma factor [Selenomonas ruminantium]